jgi:hypothetical protein
VATFAAGLWALTLPAAAQLRPLVPEPYFWPSPATAGLEALIDLQGNWQGAEGLVPVPSAGPGGRRRTIHRQVILPKTTDSLWLYFEGIAGRAAIYWDGRLLARTPTDPFSPVQVPIPRPLLGAGPHILRVALLGEGRWQGMHRAAWLLRRARSLAAPEPSPPTEATPGEPNTPDSLPPAKPKLSPADSLAARYRLPDSLAARPLALPYVPGAAPTLAWQPFHPDWGYRLPDGWARAQLSAGYARGARVLWLPQALPTRLARLAATMGFRQARAPGARHAVLCTPPDSLGWIADTNALFRPDFDPPLGDTLQPIWLAADGHPAGLLGRYGVSPEVAASAPVPPVPFVVLLLALLPLGILVVWKLQDDASFRELLSPALYSSKHLEAAVQNQLVRGIALLFASLTRLLIGAVTVGLLIWLLRPAPGVWLGVSDALLHARAILGGLLGWPEVWLPLGFVLVIFVFALSWGVLGYLFLGGLGRLYRRRQLGERLLVTEMLASFPLLPMLAACLLFVAAVPPGAGQAAIWLAGALGAVGLARRWLLLWVGLRRVVRLPGLLVVMYICAAEILPWLVVFVVLRRWHL